MTKLEDLPLISINVKIMKFWSYILVHNWKRYAALIPCCALNICQFIDMYFTEESIESVTANVYGLVLWFNTISRACYLLANRKKFERLLYILKQLYFDVKSLNDKYADKLLDDLIKMSKQVSISNMFVGLFTCFGFSIYPFVTAQKILPFAMQIPGIDVFKSPLYEIIYIIETILAPVGCCMYIPFTSLIVTFMMFAVVLQKLLINRIKNINGFENEPSKEIAWCVEFHKRIINFVEDVNNLTTYVSLVEFLSFGGTLCVLLFLLNIVSSIAQIGIVCWFTLMILTQIFLTYWYSQEVITYSELIGQAAYDMPWYNLKVKNQKKILLIIMRAQKPSQITIGALYPMTLEMFQTLLNTAYTYFTMLTRFYGQEE